MLIRYLPVVIGVMFFASPSWADNGGNPGGTNGSNCSGCGGAASAYGMTAVNSGATNGSYWSSQAPAYSSDPAATNTTDYGCCGSDPTGW